MFDHNSPAEEVFSAASKQVLSGRSIESVLAEYPEYAAELEPLLNLVASIHALPPPALSPQALAQIQQRAQADARHPSIRPSRSMERGPQGQRLVTGGASLFDRLFPGLGVLRSGLAVALLLVVAIGVTLAADTLLHRHGSGQPVESYSGVITRIQANEWLLGGDTHMIIDGDTEIHGNPVVGAQMTCVAVRLPGADRYRAIEVWIRPGPGTPTAPTGGDVPPEMAMAP